MTEVPMTTLLVAFIFRIPLRAGKEDGGGLSSSKWLENGRVETRGCRFTVPDRPDPVKSSPLAHSTTKSALLALTCRGPQWRFS